MSGTEAELPERGSLEGLALARLLLALHARGWSGTLELARGRTLRRVELAAGQPVYAESSLPSEGLARHLVDRAVLSEADAERAGELRARRGGRELAAVAALGRLAPRELVSEVRGYLRSRLADALAWPDGSFRLDPEAPPAEGVDAFRLDPRPLVAGALAHSRRPDEILAALGERVQAWPEPARGLAALRRRLALPEAADAALDALDGTRDVWSWVSAGAPPEALAALFVAGELGALGFRSAPLRNDAPEDEAEEGEAAEAAAPEIEIAVAGAGADPGADARTEAAAGASGASAGEGAEGRAAELREEVLDLHGRLDSITLYEVLGLGRDASRADVKRAYVKAAKRLHPDAVAREGLDDVKDEANALFARIGHAHSVLSDPDERERYDAELEGDTRADAERVARAEALFRKGELLLRAGSFAESIAFLEPAAEACPDEPDYRSALGWALFKKNPPEPERARSEIEGALEAQPETAVHLLRLGMLLRGSGDRGGGDPLVAKARRIDPNARP